ncbi:MAG: hypothetical protein JNM96_08925 [Bacteroidia bacterium]|nr:hypothetical protein [Bacteroidia bacterium]
MHQEEKNRKSQRIIAIIALLLLLTSIGDIFLFNKNDTLSNERNKAVLRSDSLLASKLSCEKQLVTITNDFARCQKNTSELDIEISGLKMQLEKKNAEIVRLQNASGIPGKSKKQIKDLQKQNEVCNEQVKKLLNEVGQLEAKVKELTDKIGSLMADKEDLKNKLDKAKSLKAYDIAVTNFKNQKVTQKAKRTNRININFLIPENELAEAGSKDIHVLIINPKGQVISTNGTKFENKTLNKEQVFSAMKLVNYNNQDVKTSIDFECGCKLEKGNYKTELYIDGKLAGKKDFVLK